MNSGRRVKIQFQGTGARLWLPGRTNGFARGAYFRLATDGRLSNKQIPSKVQRCLNSLLSAGGYSAYQPVFGSNSVLLLGWGADGKELPPAQDTSASELFAQRWTLRMIAQEAALKEGTDCAPLRLPAFTKSFNCANVTRP